MGINLCYNRGRLVLPYFKIAVGFCESPEELVRELRRISGNEGKMKSGRGSQKPERSLEEFRSRFLTVLLDIPEIDSQAITMSR